MLYRAQDVWAASKAARATRSTSFQLFLTSPLRCKIANVRPIQKGSNASTNASAILTEVVPLRAFLDTAGDIAGRRDTSAAALVATAAEVAGRRDTGAGAKAAAPATAARQRIADLSMVP
jgi:hypothetical protein